MRKLFLILIDIQLQKMINTHSQAFLLAMCLTKNSGALIWLRLPLTVLKLGMHHKYSSEKR